METEINEAMNGLIIGLILLLFLYALMVSWSVIFLYNKNEKMLKILKEIYEYSQLRYVSDIKEIIEEKVPESATWVEETI
jgi:hypothetical protein